MEAKKRTNSQNALFVSFFRLSDALKISFSAASLREQLREKNYVMGIAILQFLIIKEEFYG